LQQIVFSLKTRACIRTHEPNDIVDTYLNGNGHTPIFASEFVIHAFLVTLIHEMMMPHFYEFIQWNLWNKQARDKRTLVQCSSAWWAK